jgi:transketolase
MRMKKIVIFFLSIILVGCVTIEIPEQIKEEYAYTRIFKGNFETSIDAASKALKDLGWKVSYVSRSMLTKKDRVLDNKPIQQAYIFTDIKQTLLLFTSSYSIFNVRIKVIDEANTEIGVRYLSVTLIPPFYNKKISYRNDKLVKKLYRNIQRYLKHK